MTRTYFLTEGRVVIGQMTDRTMVWWCPPSTLVRQLHAIGPAVGVIDDQGTTYTGDLFWDWSGSLAWDLSAVEGVARA